MPQIFSLVIVLELFLEVNDFRNIAVKLGKFLNGNEICNINNELDIVIKTKIERNMLLNVPIVQWK